MIQSLVLISYINMLSLTVLLSILSVVGATPAPLPTPAPYYDPLVPRTKPGVGSHGTTWVNYTAIPGFFLQDDEKTDPATFDYVCPITLSILAFF